MRIGDGPQLVACDRLAAHAAQIRIGMITYV